MKKKLYTFITSHWDQKSSLLLALSGGPDSRALLHLLVELQKSIPFKLGIAHVDHCWRAESKAEAELLKKLVEKLGLHFHLKVLNPQRLKGNLEAACREERLQFFKELCQSYHYQAVLLGHHANDQSETVLKRIFEGSSLPHLAALKATSTFNGIALWRPLLNTWKSELQQELASHQIQAFDDETNQDPRFLRARFRTRLLPWLSNQFGKQISSHLKNLASESLELQVYLDKKIAPVLSNTIISPFGALLDLQKNLSFESLEQRHLIRMFCKNLGLSISKEALHQATLFLADGSAGKSISCGKHRLYIDRYCLFALNDTVLQKSQPIHLETGSHSYGQWLIKIEDFTWNDSLTTRSTDWHSVWRGKTQILLDKTRHYTLALPKHGDLYPRSSSLKKWWNNAKVPAFIRDLVPVIFEKETIVHEFLSGKNMLKFAPNHPLTLMTLEWNRAVKETIVSYY